MSYKLRYINIYCLPIDWWRISPLTNSSVEIELILCTHFTIVEWLYGVWSISCHCCLFISSENKKLPNASFEYYFLIFMISFKTFRLCIKLNVNIFSSGFFKNWCVLINCRKRPKNQFSCTEYFAFSLNSGNLKDVFLFLSDIYEYL